MSDGVKEAAERLLNEVMIDRVEYGDEGDGLARDIEIVARFALDALTGMPQGTHEKE